MILSSGVVGYLSVESAIMLLSGVALASSVQIVRRWDFGSTSDLQYALEKRAFFVSSAIGFALIAKLFLIIYFLYLIDGLTPYIRAAMCGVGVINATDNGWELLLLKIFNLYLFGLWLTADRVDKKRLDYPFTRFKFIFFIAVFALLGLEYWLVLDTFFTLETQKVVSCCSVTFANQNIVGDMINLSRERVGWLLGGSFGVYLVLWFFRGRAALFFGLVSLLFGAIGLLSVVYFISPYIYELPTHNCPFCLIQKEYGFVGYFLYALLFGGSYFGVEHAYSKAFLKEKSRADVYSLILSSGFMVLVFYFVVGYYLKNGVWL